VRPHFVLPLPRVILHPVTLLGIAAVHVYLGGGHMAELMGGHVEWTHIWKGFGALIGAYVFVALASRRTLPQPDKPSQSASAVGGAARP
jgi:hypothetical protein